MSDILSKREAARKFYSNNFFYFARDVCEYSDLKSAPHMAVADFLVDTPGNGTNRVSNSNYGFKVKKLNVAPNVRRLIILEPRNTFKSSMAKAYIVWRLLKNPYLHILLIAYSDKKATAVLGEIEGRFHRDKLVGLFGDYCPKGKSLKPGEKFRWNESELQLWDAPNGCLVPYSSNMGNLYAVGLGTDIVSLHCDIAILDDVVVKENSQTSDARDKVKEYMAYLRPIVNPGGEVILDGTRYDDDDYYGEVLRDDSFDVRLMKCHNADGSLYFPERLSESFLAEEKQGMGEYLFACQYDNDPINAKNQIFKEDWVSRCISGYRTNPPDREKLRVVNYVDPAFAKKKRSNRTAMMVMGMNPKGQMWMMDESVGKWTDDELVEKAYELEHRHAPEAHGIEANAAQALFGRIFQLEGEKRKEKLTIRQIEHSTRIDKNSRIRSLMPYIERTQIYINPSCVNLLSELRRFNLDSKTLDDCLDAFEGAKSMLRPPELKEVRTPDQARKEAAERSMRDQGYEKKILSPNFEDKYEEMFQ